MIAHHARGVNSPSCFLCGNTEVRQASMANPGISANPSSVVDRPSETATATAFIRALAAHDAREEIRCADYLAEIFLTEERKKPLQDAAVRQWVTKNKLTPGAYEFMIARTAFFDHVVEQSLKENIPQVVFLGAGYDSRPYRFKDWIRATKIFELDAQPTQQRKKEQLRQANVPIPGGLVFVAVDFNTDALADVLARAEFDKNQKTLFVWEGVTYYLSAQVVDNTLRSVRSIAPIDSSICFDYAALSPDAFEQNETKQLREKMRSEFAAEPTRFGIPAGTIEQYLTARGFAVKEHMTPDEMERKYLVLRDGSSAGKLPGLFCFVRALVN